LSLKHSICNRAILVRSALPWLALGGSAGPTDFCSIHKTTSDGLHAPGLAFGDPRVMALLASLVHFSHLLAGFTNHQLVDLVASLWAQPYSSRQATYDLRRLRRKGLINRVPGSHYNHLTPLGRRVAVLFTKAHGRVLAPGLALASLAWPKWAANAGHE
jgi:hypothetical protein